MQIASGKIRAVVCQRRKRRKKARDKRQTEQSFLHPNLLRYGAGTAGSSAASTKMISAFAVGEAVKQGVISAESTVSHALCASETGGIGALVGEGSTTGTAPRGAAAVKSSVSSSTPPHKSGLRQRFPALFLPRAIFLTPLTYKNPEYNE